VVRTMQEAGLSLRDAVTHSGSSWNLLYHQLKPRFVAPDGSIVEHVKQLIIERPSYGTRRIAAQLSRELETPINRKRVQRIFRILGYIEPQRTKNEIIRAKDKTPKASSPYQLWQTDLTYVPCGVDGWGYSFNVFDVFSREWVGKKFDLTAVKENAIASVESSLASHRNALETDDDGDGPLRLRADNGPQYTSNAFRESVKALGLRLEHIMYRTPEQNGSIESFHKTLKREYVWPFEFNSFQDAERAMDGAFIDYNQNRIHSSLGYLTPYEFLELWNNHDDEEEQNKTEEEKLNVC
jgi:putative transposase